MRSQTAEKIDFSYSTPHQHIVARTFIKSVERMTGQLKLRKLYVDHKSDKLHSTCFFSDAIRLLGLDIDLRGVPPIEAGVDGPVVFIANHPYGVMDGIVFSWLVQQIRPGTKVMANSVLCRAPEAREHLLPVDFDQTKQALKTNLQTRKSAMDIARSGGAIGLFPAGGVAASGKALSGPALDPQWSPFLAKLVRVSGATVVPIFFAGQNSRLFQIASHTSYNLRLALYFHETSRLMRKKMQVAIGEPVTADELSVLSDNGEMVRHLRQKTFDLANEFDLPKHRIPSADKNFQYPAKFGL